MREKWALRIVLHTALIVLFLAFIFARIHNPSQVTDTVKKSEPSPSSILSQPDALELKRIEKGKQIYMQQSCSLCHSISGQGNPRNPLDGIGAKHTSSELRNFITGADTLKGVLPEGVRKMKQGYRKLSDDELDALVIYMQSLKL